MWPLFKASAAASAPAAAHDEDDDDDQARSVDPPAQIASLYADD